MKKTVALIFDDNSALSDKISSDEELELIAATDNGSEGEKIIKKLKPDAAICDIALKEADGLTMLERAGKTDTKIIIYSAFGGDEVIRKTRSLGAVLYLVKPLPPEVLLSRLKDVLTANYAQELVSQEEDNAAELRISNVFLSAGIPPHIKGFTFLRTGVKLAINSPEILGNITKQLYPKIADNYKTSPSKVERAIRHAIEVAWNRGRIENLNSVFGVNFYGNGDKPTNGEFIALVADRLIQEHRMGKW